MMSRMRYSIPLAIALLVTGCGRRPDARVPVSQPPADASKSAPESRTALVSAPVTAPAPVPPAPSKPDVAPRNLCPAEQGSKTSRHGAFEVSVGRDEDDNCTLSVVADRRLLVADDSGAAVYVQSADLDGDGVQELIVIADSGRSGGDANRYVFTEKPVPRLVGNRELMEKKWLH